MNGSPNGKSHIAHRQTLLMLKEMAETRSVGAALLWASSEIGLLTDRLKVQDEKIRLYVQIIRNLQRQLQLCTEAMCVELGSSQAPMVKALHGRPEEGSCRNN